MDRIALVVLMAILATSCVGTQKNSPIPWQQSVMALDTLAFPVDSVISRQVAIFQIIAPEYLSKLIALKPNRDGFLKAIEEYKDSMPGNHSSGFTKEELEKREAYCDTVCETSVNPRNGKRDIRWDIFLLYGIPTGWWILPGEWAISTTSGQFRLMGEVTYYIYTWLGEAVMLRSDTLGGYPTRVAAPLRSISKRALPIYPVSRVVSLFNNQGGINTFLVTWVQADELNVATFQNGSLLFNLRIWDGANRSVTIPSDTMRVDLSAYQKIARVAWNLRGFPVMVCVPLQLPPGKYRAEMVATGSSSNAGRNKFEFEIPRSTSIGVSDPIFPIKNPPQGNLATGAIRTPNGEALFDQCNLIFRQGSVVSAYTSVRVPKAGTYRIACGLIPLSLERKTTPRLSPISAIKEIPDSDSTDMVMGSAEKTLRVEEQADVQFVVNFSVSNGRYIFRVEVTDSTQTQWFGSASVKLEIRESVL